MSVLLFVILAAASCLAHSDKVCYDGVGCFETGAPWSSLLRPVPPPKVTPLTIAYDSRKANGPYFMHAYPDIDMGGAPYNSTLPLTIIVHGFLVNSDAEWMKDLKDAYLDTVDANVIRVGWSSGSLSTFGQAVSDTRVVGRLIAKLINHFIANYSLTPDRVHLIGHSLGGHIVSYVGKEIPRIGRLTALDPAQPFFEGYDTRVHLDVTDAVFVEVIHTDAKPFIPYFGYGMMKPCGHVDFYFNGGAFQPACGPIKDIPHIQVPADIFYLPMEYIHKAMLCDHVQSQEYIIEAYKSRNCTFWGHRTNLKQVDKYVADQLTAGIFSGLSLPLKKCDKTSCIPFGYDTIKSPLRGVFVLNTNRQSPFCKPFEEPGEGSPETGQQQDILEKA